MTAPGSATASCSPTNANGPPPPSRLGPTPTSTRSGSPSTRVLTDNGSCYRSKPFAAALGEQSSTSAPGPTAPRPTGSDRRQRAFLNQRGSLVEEVAQRPSRDPVTGPRTRPASAFLNQRAGGFVRRGGRAATVTRPGDRTADTGPSAFLNQRAGGFVGRGGRAATVTRPGDRTADMPVLPAPSSTSGRAGSLVEEVAQRPSRGPVTAPPRTAPAPSSTSGRAGSLVEEVAQRPSRGPVRAAGSRVSDSRQRPSSTSGRRSLVEEVAQRPSRDPVSWPRTAPQRLPQPAGGRSLVEEVAQRPSRAPVTGPRTSHRVSRQALARLPQPAGGFVGRGGRAATVTRPGEVAADRPQRLPQPAANSWRAFLNQRGMPGPPRPTGCAGRGGVRRATATPAATNHP